MKELRINTDKNQLDVNFITDFISNSYWGKGRTKEMMQVCIDNSLNFGIYSNDRQIGYARVVTDFAQFAYIMDVFIHENYRGMGNSKKLMAFIMEFEQLKNIKVWRLATLDAHNLYKQFGFTSLEKPENFMEFVKQIP